MDVLEKLKMNMGYTINCVFVNCGNDEESFLEEMFKLIENDIGVNFDSERFYLLDFKINDSNIIYFDIDFFNAPLDLLVMIKELIQHGRMDENIKNKKYLIHFRNFEDNVYLEDKNNTLRVEAFLQMHSFMRDPTKIRVFLINKCVEIMNRLQDPDIEESALIRFKIQKYRTECVLRAIEERTIQTH
jgi:hypothetical protein